MIAQNTIQITNAIELSIPYLNRFFSKAGNIEKISKDQDRKVVYIEFQSKSSIEKALVFNGRVLDKKPTKISKLNQIKKQTQPQVEKKKKNVNPTLQPTSLKRLPGLHQFNESNYKITKRSEYRLIEHLESDSETITFESNPLEGITNKQSLWKIILHQMTKNLIKDDNTHRELILSSCMGIWALIQLKLQQIRYLMEHNESMKSKYIENFIQDIVVNKLNLLKNDKLINNSNRFKTVETQRGLQFAFNVPYPQQNEQEAKFSCETDHKTYKFLCTLYQNSRLLAKIYHELHTNSLILYEDRQILTKIIEKFYVKTSQNFIYNCQINSQNSFCQTLEKEDQSDFKETISSFSGQIENYGSYIFHNLIPFEAKNHYNSMVWVENKRDLSKNNKIYPQFFSSNFIFNDCKSRILAGQSFFNIYIMTPFTNSIIQKQSHIYEDHVLVFQDGQFSFEDIVQNTLGYIHFQLGNILFSKNKTDSKKQSSSTQPFNSRLHSVICLHSQTDLKESSQNNKVSQDKELVQFSLDCFYVGLYIKEKENIISNYFNKLLVCIEKMEKYFCHVFPCFQVQIKLNLLMIEMIPSKQNEFNAFKCENYLINHIDKHIIGRNSIIASEEFAVKVAEKILEDMSKNELFGFKDKKYIGSQIWRLYNKSGVRRAKLKISQHHFKRLNS